MINNYTPGQGCKCHAHSEAECGCDVDWTPREVYELRAKISDMEIRHSAAMLHTQSIVDEANELREQRDMLAIGLRKLIELDDNMRDPDYDESGTYAGAYYCYYKGECDTWEGARAALASVKGGSRE